MSDIKFEAGNHIILKIPKDTYDATVRFYRDILLLEVEEKTREDSAITPMAKVTFGSGTLWLDCIPDNTQSETWLQLQANDLTAALNYLHTNDIIKDDISATLPEGGYRIQDPSGNNLLLRAKE